MKTYARIQDSLVAELFSTDLDIAELFHPDLIWVDITDEANAPQCGWSYIDGVFSEPAGPSAEFKWGQCQRLAQIALDESDLTILRCYERSIPVPAEWAAYRTSLRSVISAKSGDPAQPLPARPSYPAGT